MADEHYLNFAAIFGQDILFEDYVSDSFLKSSKSEIRVIQNNGHKFLVVDGECLKFEERTRRQSRKDDCQFQICCYGNSDPSTISVTLMVYDKGKPRLICCRDNGNRKDVYAKLQEDPLPNYIEKSHHEAIFFLEVLKERPESYRIKSSLWPELFLAFEETDGVEKLVLRNTEGDLTDAMKMTRPL